MKTRFYNKTRTLCDMTTATEHTHLNSSCPFQNKVQYTEDQNG